jgi:hypothetical protein
LPYVDGPDASTAFAFKVTVSAFFETGDEARAFRLAVSTMVPADRAFVISALEPWHR